MNLESRADAAGPAVKAAWGSRTEWAVTEQSDSHYTSTVPNSHLKLRLCYIPSFLYLLFDGK